MKLQERYKSFCDTDKCRESGNGLVTVVAGDFTECLPFEGEFDLILDRSSVTHNNTADICKKIAHWSFVAQK